MTVVSCPPTVAVVIPYYKTIDLIARAVHSAAANECVTEIIVADDGSNDGVAAVVTPIDPRVVCLSGPNAGAPNARNRGLRHASADWVLFLDADDYLDPAYVDHIVSDKDSADIIIGQVKRVAADGTVFDVIRYPQGLTRAELVDIRLTLPMQTGASLWSRKYTISIGGWDERLIIFQDAEIMLRAFLLGARVIVADTSGLSAYWVDDNRFDRITTYSEAKSACVLGVLKMYSPSVLSLNNGVAPTGLGVRLYSLARMAFTKGYFSIGREALREYHSLGFKGHIGSRTHRLFSTTLGLELKTRLINVLRGPAL